MECSKFVGKRIENFKYPNNNYFKLEKEAITLKMKKYLLRLKEKIMGSSTKEYDYPDQFGEDYLEIDTTQKESAGKQKIIIKPFVISDFNDIKEPMDSLREGYTIVLLNIKPLKDKDLIELKRTVNKLKKTCEAIDGDIAGFGEDWIVAMPHFARVHRTPQTGVIKEE